MQKKMVGILASVAAAHAVLAIALMTGGGCRQTKILAPHTYNNGPEVAQVPAASTDIPPTRETPESVPQIQGGDTPIAPAPVEPAPQVKYNDPVPTPPVAPPAAGGTKTYKVKKGDSLSKIAYLHGVRTRDLAACNNIPANAMNMIRIGQVLTIPEGGVYNESRKAKPSTKKSAVKPGKKAARKGKKSAKPAAALPADGIYVVKSGDSLDRIGRRYGVSARAIAKENNIALTKVLQIGDKLRIPGKAAATAEPAIPASDAPTATPSTPADDKVLDNLDPNAGLDSAAAPVAADSTTAAVPATETTAAPAVTETGADMSASVKTDSIEVVEDMTVEEFSKRNMISVDTVRRLNPNLPADGKLKGGTFLSVPGLK